ncbi:MAG: PAS domain S-box protein [Methylotenera sp.]
MKINMPVTNNEIHFDDSEFMLTKTDLRGYITYANQDFIKVSGFSESELIGANHNILRHPDMPVEAFEDMWRNLKEGKPWTGMVKNRTKAGDYYWVMADTAPIFENGQITGYLSARKKPTRQQIDAAADAYRLFKDGKARGLSIVDGNVVENTWLYKLKNRVLSFKVAQRITGIIVLAVMVAITQAALGLYELSIANNSLKNVYENRMKPAEDLRDISNLMLENLNYLRVALSEVKIGEVTAEDADRDAVLVMNPEIAAKSADAIEQNIKTIGGLWTGYVSADLTPEEKVLADKFVESRGHLVEAALKPSLLALRAHNYEETRALAEKARELYTVAAPDITALIKLQSGEANKIYKSAATHFANICLLTVGGLTAAVFILIWLGLVVARSITKPLEKSIEVFGDIASNKLDTSIDVHGSDELSHVLQSLKTMQTMVNVNVNEQRELADKVREQSAQYEGQLAAISKSTGVIEFSMAGKVITANDNFLNALGYSLSEVVGQPHSAFVDAGYSGGAEYRQFWEKLNRGESVAGQFQRIGKNGKDVWLEATYNPILDVNGKPYKVVKYATDITEQKIRNADFEGQIAAIGKSQGVVEVGLDGTILKANEAYLQMLGYTEKELVGQHARVVLDPTFAKSAEYAALWDKLVQGGNDSGQYKRIAKNGKEVWIQASYNPIYDLNGKPYKIVNYTIDITAQKLLAADNASQIAAINKIQGVIEFDLTGKITAVNENFANMTGYGEKEVVGNHHSMFVDAAYKSSHDYQAFWEKLGRGEADTGQYRRLGKGGRDIWLQATYNPIFDLNGLPFKVVKYATDITEQHNNTIALAGAVEETQAIIEGAKAGDLSSRVPLEGKAGAIASLCDGVNALMDKMTEVIVQVREAGETINTAASEISTGNNDLSRRTEQQASSLEQTASSMEELASTVKQNAENAKQANQLAGAASGVAVKGGNVVKQVITTMVDINASSRKIEDIITVIDGIAFQTNILALNAAVEAARAGEQGRGFAVVAGEVRNLAQRSASAAKEIKELISDSVSKVHDGSQLVEDAGKTMEEVVTSVQRVTDIMGEITAASVEQSAGIDLVNQAVTQMDEVTQQNAALVEEAAAASESLVDQAVSLMETVSVFKLNDGSSISAIKVVARPAARPGSSGLAAAPNPSVPKFASGPAVMAKTGTDDSEWEEF